MIAEPYNDLFNAALAMPEPLRSELADRLIHAFLDEVGMLREYNRRIA